MTGCHFVMFTLQLGTSWNRWMISECCDQSTIAVTLPPSNLV